MPVSITAIANLLVRLAILQLFKLPAVRSKVILAEGIDASERPPHRLDGSLAGDVQPIESRNDLPTKVSAPSAGYSIAVRESTNCWANCQFDGLI